MPAGSRLLFLKKFAAFTGLAVLHIIGLSRSASAQNCTPTLGATVVFITFGKGEVGSGDPLPSGTTTLNYAYNGCPNDGDYTVTNKMDFCYTNDWHPVIKDHTGDAGGRFMVINADYNPATFYTQRVDGLCGGTTYEFASWVMNLVTLNERNPDITFSLERLDGTEIKHFSTGEILPTAQPNWKQYPFYFLMPQDVTSVIIRMRNNAAGGQGNDLLLDDITFRPAGPGIDVSFRGKTGKEISVCQQATNTITTVATTDNCILTNNLSFQWQVSTNGGNSWDNVNSTQNTYTLPSGLAPGNYLYRTLVAGDNNVEVITCRVISDPLIVHVLPTTTSSVSITSTTTQTCPGIPITFTATAVNPGPAPVYDWQVNGADVNVSVNTFSPTNLKNSDVVTCILTGQNTCSPPAASNAIKVNVTNPFKSVIISASAKDICKSTPVIFNADVVFDPAIAYSNLYYSWQLNGQSTGVATTTYTNSNLNDGDVVTFLASASVNACSTPVVISSNAISIAVHDTAVVTLPSTSYTINAGESVQLKASVNQAGVTYSWSPSSGLSSDNVVEPIAQPAKTTTYVLKVTNPSGCTTTSAPVTVNVIPKFVVTPNTFTPNGDGVNDNWNVEGLGGYPLCVVDIYSRNGELVYHSVGYSVPWDGTYKGKLLPVGTYYYRIDLRNGSKLYSGYVSLL